MTIQTSSYSFFQLMMHFSLILFLSLFSSFYSAHASEEICHYNLKKINYCIQIKFDHGKPKKNIRNKFWIKVINNKNHQPGEFEKKYYLDLYSSLRTANRQHQLRGPKITYYPINDHTYQADDARFIRTKSKGRWEIHLDIYPKDSNQKIDSFIYPVKF